jgi:hypothetical protein
MPLKDLPRKLTQLSRDPDGQLMRDPLRIWAAALALAIGVTALLCDHFQLSRAVTLEMHALFGLVATATIAAVLLEKARSCATAAGPDLYLYTRLVSRWVYILIYCLALVRVGLYLLEADQSHVSHVAHHRVPPPRPLADFQFYVTWCVIPLWLVRALVLSIPFDRRTGDPGV